MSSAFRAYFVEPTLSMFGDRFNELAVPIIVLAATDSAFTAGIVTAANRVPALLFALPIGVLVDRVSRHRLMLIGGIGHRETLAVMAVLFFAAAVPLWRTRLARVPLQDLSPVEIERPR